MSTPTISVLVLTVLAVGCGGLPEPHISNSTTGDGDSQPQTLSATPPKPTLSAPTTATGYPTVPIFGQTEASTAQNDNLVIVVGGASKGAGDVGTDGSFCVDVALKQGKNALTFVTQRADGSVSDPVHLTVTYDPSLANNSNTSSQQHTGSVKDQALNKSASANMTGTNLKALTDGDDSTVCTFQNSSWNYWQYAIVYLDLGAVFSVQRIEIQWAAAATASGEYADDYDIVTSVAAQAQQPDGTETGGWSQAASVSGPSGGNGDGGLDTFTFGTPISARWVGIAVYSNNTPWYSMDYAVQIASIRVYAPDIFTAGGTNFGPPTCDNVTQ